MKNYLLVALLSGLVLFVSCGEDEPPIDPLVGEWELDEIEFSNPPSGHRLATNPVTESTIWGESSYIITFNADGTYERELDRSQGDVEDEGTWEKDGEDLDLDQDETNADDLVTSFTIDEIDDKKMTLIGRDAWFAWPPEIVNDPLALDTLENDEINDFFVEYGVIVDFTVTMEFDRN